MKIGHWQLESAPGDIDANVYKVVDRLHASDRMGLSLVSFPESFIHGYFRDEADARKHSWSLDDPALQTLLIRTANIKPMWMVGINERRGDKLYNTVIVAQRGRLIGHYSKAFPCIEYFTPGRAFPVFECEGVKFGVVICADGGYIEPTRICALQGAQLIVAPHYNYIAAEGLINHFQKVRSDHIARAVENNVYFLRGNNVVTGRDEGLKTDGVGYGDSYLLDPNGEIVARTQRHVEGLLTADIDFDAQRRDDTRSLRSAQELGQTLLDTLAAKEQH